MWFISRLGDKALKLGLVPLMCSVFRHEGPWGRADWCHYVLCDYVLWLHMWSPWGGETVVVVHVIHWALGLCIHDDDIWPCWALMLIIAIRCDGWGSPDCWCCYTVPLGDGTDWSQAHLGVGSVLLSFLFSFFRCSLDIHHVHCIRVWWSLGMGLSFTNALHIVWCGWSPGMGQGDVMCSYLFYLLSLLFFMYGSVTDFPPTFVCWLCMCLYCKDNVILML